MSHLILPRGGLIRLVESAPGATMTRPASVSFAETVALPEGIAGAKARRFRCALIEAGWSLNGRYWGADVLAEWGPVAIAEGRLMAGDHPNDDDRATRPEGSIFRQLSRIASKPAWNPTGGRAGKGALEADVEVFPHAVSLLTPEYVRSIGLSVRVTGLGEHGEAEGREGLIIRAIDEGGTVDWVTYAGAGGRVLDLLESAAPVAAHEGHGMTSNDLHRSLQSAIDRAHRDRSCWAWIVDVHDDFVIFDIGGRDSDEGRYRQSYTVDTAGTATLSGEPVQVNTQTAYVPVVAPVDAAEATPLADSPSASPPSPGAPVSVQDAIPVAVPVAETITPIKEAVVTTPEPTGAPPTGAASTTGTGANPYTIEAVESLKRKAAQQAQDLVETNAQLEVAKDDRAARIKAEESLNASLTENARLRATESARSQVAAACATAGLFECVHPWVASTVIGPEGAFIPLSESREVDGPALKGRIDSTVERWADLTKKICEAAGADGRVRGLGAPASDEGMTEAQFEESLARRFASLPGMSEKTAAVAAKGR